MKFKEDTPVIYRFGDAKFDGGKGFPAWIVKRVSDTPSIFSVLLDDTVVPIKANESDLILDKRAILNLFFTECS